MMLNELIPHSIRHQLRTKLRSIRYRGEKRFCPICRTNLRCFLSAGRARRPNALCPICRSVERHRLIWMFWNSSTELTKPRPQTMLHVAPEPCLEQTLGRLAHLQRITVDLMEPAAMRVDLTRLAFADAQFDVVYASHVLEHIPDDRAAMQEIRRVLKPNGWAVLQVPLADADHTDEDATVHDPLERERRFGQRDHVRFYGRDYYDRLTEAGFRVERKQIAAQLDPTAALYYGLDPNEEITFCVPRS